MSYRILQIDPSLEPYESEIKLRMDRLQKIKARLLGKGKTLSDFANGALYYGFHQTEDGWVFREWLPSADEVHLMGDFNGWNRYSHPLCRLADGSWEIRFSGRDSLWHGQHVKLWIRHGKEEFERIPAYITRAVQDEHTRHYCGQIWNAPPYPWTDQGFEQRPLKPLLIYEAHIGMAQEKGSIGSYREFTQNVLPRIARMGYTAIQLMAIAEHPYYASFGYQVTNFYAASSWYGDPEGLKELINTAHGYGIQVLLDVVHSHASPNIGEGLYLQDGTDRQYFLQGEEGWHPAWKTKLFDYSRDEVLHFLLSNLKFWMEEYHFDGFRFDGVTSMLYRDHGLGRSFMDYSMYFSLNTNIDALNYLQLANELVHGLNPNAITIAEDMSGMPGMAFPVADGGIGFDYRLAMGMPDLWIKLIKEVPMANWDIGKIWYELTNRRKGEKSVAYCESHDQALVGDKTLIFRMADKEMYTSMSRFTPSLTVDLALDFHKLIRFLTLSLGGEGYLTFMGNEFGHPEWIDFPREGNGWSYHYARRQWSLADRDDLKYSYLNEFEREMLRFAKRFKVLNLPAAVNLWMDYEQKLMAFARGSLIWLFNLHTDHSEREAFVPAKGSYQVIFSSDEKAFGGQARIASGATYQSYRDKKRGEGFLVYSPCRTVMVFEKIG